MSRRKAGVSTERGVDAGNCAPPCPGTPLCRFPRARPRASRSPQMTGLSRTSPTSGVHRALCRQRYPRGPVTTNRRCEECTSLANVRLWLEPRISQGTSSINALSCLMIAGISELLLIFEDSICCFRANSTTLFEASRFIVSRNRSAGVPYQDATRCNGHWKSLIRLVGGAHASTPPTWSNRRRKGARDEATVRGTGLAVRHH